MDLKTFHLFFLLLAIIQSINAYQGVVRVALNKATTMEAGIAGQPVTTYYLNLDIGTPPKSFKLLLDINAKETWLPHYLKMGLVYYRLRYSNGYSKKGSTSSVKEDREYNIDYQNCQLTGKPYEDFFTLQNVTESFKPCLFKQRFLAISSASNGMFSEYPTDGVVSLSPVFMSDTGTRSLLINMNQAGLINELKFALYLNSNLESSDGGELVLGGFNPTKYVGSIYYHSLANLNTGHWDLNLQNVMLGSQVVSCNQKNCTATLSTGVNELYGPIEDVHRIMTLLAVFKQKQDKSKKDVPNYDELYEIECLRVADLPTITFNIDGINYTVPPTMYVKKKVDGLIFKTSTCYVTIFANKSTNQWVLGTNFLANYYTIYDFNRRQVGIAGKR